MLEALSDLEIASKVMSKKSETDSVEDPIDTQYKALKCDIEALDKSSKQYDVIEKYVHNTHAPTHNDYKYEVLDVYAIKRFSLLITLVSSCCF